jgi:hypothetical protein
MLISTALLLDSNIRNSVCTPAKLPCRRVEVGYKIILIFKPWRVMLTCEKDFLKASASSFFSPPRIAAPAAAINVGNLSLPVVASPRRRFARVKTAENLKIRQTGPSRQPRRGKRREMECNKSGVRQLNVAQE